MDMNEIRNELQKSYGTGYNDGYSKGYEDGCADRPQGEWVDVWQDGVCSWRGTCSNCRRTNDIPPPMLAKYCPQCGAKMKGADDE